MKRQGVQIFECYHFEKVREYFTLFLGDMQAPASIDAFRLAARWAVERLGAEGWVGGGRS